MDNALATLLTPYNVALGAEIINAALVTAPTRHDVARVMRNVGFSSEVTNAIACIERGDFVQANLVATANFNETVQNVGGSYLSAPGIVAYMLDRALSAVTEAGISIERILEVGSGSGYHLALAGSLFRHADLVGYEADLELCELSMGNLGERFGSRVRILNDIVSESTVFPDTVGLIYHTACSVSGPFPSLANSLVVGGIYQYVRALTPAEFEIHEESTWLSRTFVDYDAYLAGEWSSACCIETAVKTLSEGLVVVDQLYGVRFVRLQT